MNFHEKAHPIEADVAAVVVERNGSAPLVPCPPTRLPQVVSTNSPSTGFGERANERAGGRMGACSPCRPSTLGRGSYHPTPRRGSRASADRPIFPANVHERPLGRARLDKRGALMLDRLRVHARHVHYLQVVVPASSLPAHPAPQVNGG
jgi:hypothetical protein